MEIASLIVQQLRAGVVSLLALVPIWLILLNQVTYYGSDSIFTSLLNLTIEVLFQYALRTDF